MLASMAQTRRLKSLLLNKTISQLKKMKEKRPQIADIIDEVLHQKAVNARRRNGMMPPE